METQLHFDSGAKQLGLCFKERFRTDQGITLKVPYTHLLTSWRDPMLKCAAQSEVLLVLASRARSCYYPSQWHTQRLRVVLRF